MLLRASCSAIAALAFVLGLGCGREPWGAQAPVPAAGPLEERGTEVRRIGSDDPDVLRRSAHIVRTIDELGDRKMTQATVASLAAQDEEVRAYAAELLDDYRLLRAREARLGIALGFVPIKGDKAEGFEHRVHTEMLSLMEHRGADFDRAFVGRMIQEHEAALRLLDTTLMREAPLPELRDNLQHDVRRLLTRHLERAKQLYASLERAE